ncbi:hypothetical protein [Thermococcus sp.]|nr:hypothetical protein [Thermococcus sp.]
MEEYVWLFKNNSFSAKDALESLRGYMEDPRSRGLSESPKIIESALNFLVGEKISLSRFNDVIVLLHALEKRTLITLMIKSSEACQKEM